MAEVAQADREDAAKDGQPRQREQPRFRLGDDLPAGEVLDQQAAARKADQFGGPDDEVDDGDGADDLQRQKAELPGGWLLHVRIRGREPKSVPEGGRRGNEGTSPRARPRAGHAAAVALAGGSRLSVSCAKG